MKDFKISKKALILFLCVFMVVFAVSASAATKDWTDLKNTFGTDPVEHNHVYGEWKVSVPATCTTPGTRIRECLFAKDGEHCPFVYQEEIPVNPDAHVKGNIEEIEEPTCSKMGKSSYECTVCHTTVTVNVGYVDHKYDKEWTVIDPIHDETKEEPGLKYNKCIVCGETQEIIIPVEHTYKDDYTVITPATCSSIGQKLVYCTYCKKNKMEPIEIDPTNHVYSGKALAIGEVSCTDGGRGIVTCEACGETDYVNIPASEAHDYLEWDYTAPKGTCKDGTNGSIVKVCKVHGNITDPVEWKNHNFDSDAKTHAATCSDYGYIKGKCLDCGLENVQEIIPVNKDKHSWVEEVLIEPTCETQGYVFRMCKYDSSHVEYSYIEKAGHTYYTDWTIDKEATCYEEGVKTNKCVVCDETITIIIPINPDNHPIDEEDWEIYEENFPTCTKVGIEAAHCDKCVSDDELVFREVPMHTNTLSVYKTTPATCKRSGETVYNCYLCGEYVTEVIPVNPLAHKTSKDYYVTKEATCYEKGIKSKVCDFCFMPMIYDEDEHKTIYLDETPHTVTEWEVTADPTCTKDGEKVRRCIVEECGYVETVAIAKTHRYKAWATVTPATCKTAGVRSRGCYNCDKTWTETYFTDCVAGDWKFYKGSDNDTCNKGDTFRKSCVTCNREMEEKTLKSGEHISLVEGAIENNVSDSICSRKVSTCTYCNGTVTVTTNHTYTKTKEGLEPTCTTSGYEPSYFCYLCKRSIAGLYLPATDHNFEYDEEGSKYCLNCNLYFVQDSISGTCDHFCHNKGTIAKVLTKVLSFFWKLFGNNHFCECGAPHYHQEETTVISKTLTEEGQLEIIYSCKACKVESGLIVL